MAIDRPLPSLPSRAKLDWQAARHEADVANRATSSSDFARTNGSYSDGGDDFEIETGAPDIGFDDADDGDPDFEAGYNDAGGVGTFVRERIVSGIIGFFSPPGTGALFSGGAGLMQWIFREDIESTTNPSSQDE